MGIATDVKNKIIADHKRHEGDTGSAEVQIALLTERISDLTKHFATNKKDHSSRRGLLMMVGRRRKLLSYLKKHDEDKYKSMITELSLRK